MERTKNVVYNLTHIFFPKTNKSKKYKKENIIYYAINPRLGVYLEIIHTLCTKRIDFSTRRSWDPSLPKACMLNFF